MVVEGVVVMVVKGVMVMVVEMKGNDVLLRFVGVFFWFPLFGRLATTLLAIEQLATHCRRHH